MPVSDRKRRLSAFLVAMAVLVATPLAVVAADAFTDVPDTNVFHEDIAWLAAAGVTKGCNPPANTEFCPSDNVTREQMSAFMRRLAQYMGAEDGTPAQADNASTLDGYKSSELVSAFGELTDGYIGGFTETEFTDVLVLNADAPTDGFMHIVASIDAEDDCNLPGSGALEVRLTVDGTATHDDWGWELDYGDCHADDDLGDSTGLTAVVPVSAGSHDIAIQALEWGDGSFIFGRAISVLFTPFGKGVVIPAGDARPGEGNPNRP